MNKLWRISKNNKNLSKFSKKNFEFNYNGTFIQSSLWILMVLLVACAPAAQQPVKIGAIAALTGNLANIGSEERIGLEIAVDEINSQGGINGRPIQLIWEDGKCDPKEATTAATKLAEVDGVKVIMGGTCTGESMAIAKIADAGKIIQMSSVTSGSVYSGTGPWTYRTNPVDNAKDLVDYLISKGYKKFAMINEQTDFSQAIKKDFRKLVEANNGQIVAEENVDGKETDFKTSLAKLQESGADAYFLNSNSGPVGVLFAKQAKELGLAPLYGSRGYEGAKVSDYPNELEGIIFYSTVGVVNMDTPQAQKLFSEYEKKTGKKSFSPFAVASRYDGMKLIAKAMQKCGEDTACIKEYLNTMPAYEGVIGTFTFDENGDPQGIKYAFAVIHGGKIEPLK